MYVYRATQNRGDEGSRSIIRRSARGRTDGRKGGRGEIVAVEMKLEIGGNGGSLREEHRSHLPHLTVIPSDLYASHKVSRGRERSAAVKAQTYIHTDAHIYQIYICIVN